MLDMDDIEGQFLSTITSLKASEVGKIILLIGVTNILTVIVDLKCILTTGN